MKKYTLDGNIYDSKSEAAVAELLKRYIPEDILTERETVRVKIDRTNSYFILPSAIIQWRPRTRRKKSESLTDYTRRKTETASPPEKYLGRELIVVSNFDDFYYGVLARFGRRIPSKKFLMKVFGEIRLKANQIPKKDLEFILATEVKK